MAGPVGTSRTTRLVMNPFFLTAAESFRINLASNFCNRLAPVTWPIPKPNIAAIRLPTQARQLPSHGPKARTVPVINIHCGAPIKAIAQNKTIVMRIAHGDSERCCMNLKNSDWSMSKSCCPAIKIAKGNSKLTTTQITDRRFKAAPFQYHLETPPCRSSRPRFRPLVVDCETRSFDV